MKTKLYLTLFVILLGILFLGVGNYGGYFFPIGNIASGILTFIGVLLLLLTYWLSKKGRG